MSPSPVCRPRIQGPVPAASSLEKHLELAHTWELATLKLTPGSIITFYADARDFDAIKGPNVGKSREMRLRIVSKEDAARQFDDARRELREELARVLAMQKQAMTPVENAARTLSQTDRLQQPQRDDLNNASMIQRQITGRFNGRDEGLSARIRRMLDDLRNFKMANPDAQKQMEDMLARVERRPRPQPRAGRAGDCPCRQGARECPGGRGRPEQSAARTRRKGPENSRQAAPSDVSKERGQGRRQPSEGRSQERRRRRTQRKSGTAKDAAKSGASKDASGGQPEAAKEQGGASEQGGQAGEPAQRPARAEERRSHSPGARRGQDESEGDRRRAPEDAR